MLYLNSKLLLGAVFFSSSMLFAADNFEDSKKELVRLYSSLESDMRTDFYCNAPFKLVKNHFEIVPSSLYSPRKPHTKSGEINKRAKRIEWEHIMPAHNFGKHLPCWKKGGRKECKNDPLFRKMEGDVQNLVPAIGEINGDRSNFRYAESNSYIDFGQYGNCKVATDFKNKRFYPADYSKGWIARSYLYMSETYNIRLSDQELKMMNAWNKMFPMTDKERYIRNLSSNL